MREPLERLCRDIGYQFSDLGVLEQALTHRSAGSPNNERLEFLGDSILGFFVSHELYTRFPGAHEGQLSRLRSRLVRKDTLALLARGISIGSYLNLGAGELRSGGHARDSILADAMEAIFAAVYLDGGVRAARKVVLGLLKKRLSDLSPDAQQKDPKTRLQEYLQAHGHSLPSYTIIEVSGEQHAQRFVVECRIDDLDIARRGDGSSRRKGEQAAATALLEDLKD